jgi:hypothetical protein
MRHHSRTQYQAFFLSSLCYLKIYLKPSPYTGISVTKKVDPKPSISLLNKTDTFDGYDINIDIITDEVNALQKESLMLFEGYCIFDFREFYKKLLCVLVEVNKTMYGNNEDVPRKLMDIFLLGSPGIINHMIWQGGFTNAVFPQSHQTILNKQEFIIHNSVGVVHASVGQKVTL